MENKLKLLTINNSIFKVILFLLITVKSVGVYAGVEKFNARLTASQMIIGADEVGVEDDKFTQIQLGTTNFVMPSVKNRIILGVDHENQNFQSAYELTFELLVTYINASGILQSFNTNLTIDYDPQAAANQYVDRSVHQFIDGHSVKAKILQVLDAGSNPVPLMALPENLFLETEIEVERYYSFDPIQTVAITNSVVNNELNLAWNHIQGAEEYELEWSYVNDYKDVGSYIGSGDPEAADLIVDFKNNSTRVSLKKNTYSIPLTFEHGYLVYRVRAIGVNTADLDHTLYGNWTEATNQVVFNYNNRIATLHEENKNWQYSANYAEEGKKKEVISYFDGSLRNRQSVTKLNTDETAIVGETIYDHQGRGAVQVLPVPANNSEIKYYDNGFNKNDDTSPVPYSREDFDVDNGTCNTTPESMSIGSGASQYYSPNNPDKNGVNAYIPDAEKYPFTQIEYTPDNTGRIRRQSGVGINHTLGTDRETKYFYAQPGQRSLDQLFGSEVGKKAHYKKNAVVDANKQISVSYLDMQGRTIATSLAGATPDDIDELDNGTAATVYVEDEDLLAKDALGVSADNQPNVDGDAIVFTTEMLVTSDGPYEFEYQVKAAQFQDDCLLSTICFDCVYDLEITITDECGNYVKVDNTLGAQDLLPIIETVGTVNPINLDCADQDPLVMTFSSAPGALNAYLPLGVYSISKRLTINQDAIDEYIDEYLNEDNLQTGNPNCFKSLEEFETEWLSNVDYSGCEITCDNCLTSLGTEEDFIANGGTTQAYNDAVEECQDLCDHTSLCEALYRTMLADVSPGGQYAELKVMTSGPNVGYYAAHMYPLSIFNFNNKLPKNLDNNYAEKPYWRRPFPHYTDANGDVVKIPVTDFGGGLYSVDAIQIRTDVDNSLFIYPEDFTRVDDFLGYWQASFAESLVQYHPEYCYYEWCSQNSSIYGNATESSDDFDYRLLGKQTLMQAHDVIGTGFGPDLTDIINQDPFFNESGVGTITPDHWPTQSGPAIPWGVSPRMMMENILNNYPTGDPALSPYSIYEMVAITQKCGTLYGGNQADVDACLQTHFPAAYTGCTGGGVCDYNEFINTPEAWESLKGMYISAKQKVQQAMANEHAYWSCYNPCIGWDEGSFWLWAKSNMLSPVPNTLTFPFWHWPWTQNQYSYTYYTLEGPFKEYEQPCSYYTYSLYKDKVQRYQNTFIDDEDDMLSEMGNQSDYDMYYQTGVCPIARDLEYLLDALAKNGQITASGVDLTTYPQFTEDLYNSIVDPNQTSFVPYTWDVTVAPTTITININNTTIAGIIDACPEDIKLEFINMPTGFSLNDYTILKFNQLAFTSGTYDFTVQVTVQDNNNPTNPPEVLTISGSTCSDINIGSCSFDDVCETTEQAGNLLALMELLRAQDLDQQNGSDVDDNISLNDNFTNGTYTSSYDFYFSPIEALLNPTVTDNWHWNYDGNVTFTISDVSNPNSLVITFTSIPVTVSNITSFLSIAPDPANSTSGMPTNAFVMEIEDNTSAVHEVTGTISFVNGATVTDFEVGTCAPPIPTQCSSPENLRLADLHAFLNALIGLTPPVDLSTIPEYTELLSTEAGTFGLDLIKLHNIMVTGNELTADINGTIFGYTIPSYIIPGMNGEPDVTVPEQIIPDETLSYCTVSLSFLNPSTPALITDIVSIDWIQADQSQLTNGQSNGFTGMATVATGEQYEIKGSSCFAIANCTPPCIEETEICDPATIDPGTLLEIYGQYIKAVRDNPRIPGAAEEELTENEFYNTYACCWIEYQDYAILFNETGNPVYNPNSALHISLEDFCQYAECATAHYNYLKYASDNWSLSVQNSPYFVTLADFCTYNELYEDNDLVINDPDEATNDYKSYVDALLAIGADQYIVSYLDFVKYNLGSCLDDYTDCIPTQGIDCIDQTLSEYCNGGYESIACTPSPEIEEPETVPYENGCAEELEEMALLNAEGEYNQYIQDLTDDFVAAYKEKCLEAFENFTVSYNDKEHHFTLYYYDQAGNLIRTIPPAGVNKVTAQADFDQINDDRTFGTKTYFTQHTYPTTYEYNSLNQLVSQNVPDHRLINDVTVTPSNAPVINGMTVTGVQYTSNGGGYAFANDGVNSYIYLTNDNGETWSQLSSVGNQNLNSVYMINTTEGYAVGENGLLLKTIDGGMEWLEVTSFTTATLNDVYFSDLQTGITVGENGIVFTTTDGGMNWTQLTGITSGNILDIEFYDLTEGYAVVQEAGKGVIYAITNNGTTWAPINNLKPANLNAVQLLTTQNAYAAGEDGQLLYTQNAGLTWELINNGLTEDFIEIHFKTNTPNIGCAITAGNQLIATTDGGQTWTNVVPTGLTNPQFVDFYFINSNDGYAVTNNGYVTQIDLTQSSSTWTLLTNSPVNAGNNTISVFFENSTTGYVSRSGGIIEKTTDKGATGWTQLPSLATFIHSGGTTTSGPNQITAMHFDGNNGVIIGDGKDYYTSDGGYLVANPLYPSNNSLPQYITTWNQGTLTDIAQMTFIDETDGYAREATSGTIHKTTDVGLSWPTSFNSGSSVALNDLNVLSNGMTAAVVGNNGEIKITTNAGATWNDQNTIESQNLHGIAIDIDRATNQAYAVGNDGKIFKTNDLSQGVNSEWQLQLSQTVTNLNAVDFMDPTLVSAVGQGGKVYTSVSGGAWGLEYTSNNHLNDIYYYTTNEAYAVGDGGDVIVRSSNGSWAVDPNSNINENLNGVHFGDLVTPVGIAVGDGGKIHRMDGANTTCVTDVSVPVMNASQMVTNLIGYAVGEDGTIIKTTDAGISWSILVTPPSVLTTGLNALYFTSPLVGYVVGDAGTLLTTSDGGASWTPTTHGTEDLNDIYFADATTGVIVGDNGTVYTYNSTSTLWDPVSTSNFTISIEASPSGGTLTDLSTTSFNAVYAASGVWFIAGDASTLFKSMDNGLSWDELYDGSGLNINTDLKWTESILTIASIENLNDIYFADQYYGWALADNGIIIKTKDGGETWEEAANLGIATNLTAFNFNADGQAIIVGDATTSGSVPAYQFSDQSDRFSTKFWYDKLGRLIVSQNTKQNEELIPQYSYTIYDALGRIIEVGEVTQATPMASTYVGNQVDETAYLAWINAGAREEVTATYYDYPGSLVGYNIPGFVQENLRTRVSIVTYEDTYDANPLTFDHATHYSYDIHGNVDAMIQDNPKLADIGHQFKRIDYSYDLISGNVNEVVYQEGQPDQFYHQYFYDADNRITNMLTSKNGVIWDQDAKYQYYLHGPLARTEVGDLKVQAMDYAYTIQGWLKGVNSNTLVNTRDIGKDGITGHINQNIAQDEVGYTLGYFEHDYKAIDATNIAGNQFEADLAGSELLASASNLYNGNIGSMVTSIRAFMQGGVSPNAMTYKYDQLNRLKEARAHRDNTVIASNQWATSGTATNNYGVKLTYDDNGNILTLNRNGEQHIGTNLNEMDELVYTYEEIGPRKTNRLIEVEDLSSYTGGDDIQPGVNNYSYDQIGNLVQDVDEEIDNIVWSVSGKILEIQRVAASSKPDIEFVYDANGNRITKIVKPRDGSGVQGENHWNYTYYALDASGNPMAIYDQASEETTPNNYKTTFKLKNVNLYGSSRIGTFNPDKTLSEREFSATTNPTTGAFENVAQTSFTAYNDHPNLLNRTLGRKQFEMNNHLGNVLATVSDVRLADDGTDVGGNGLIDYYTATVSSAHNYYPFGMIMPSALNITSTEPYRYGFIGAENDNEVNNTTGGSQDHNFRSYDSRLGRYKSLDPLANEFPWNSPFAYAENRVIEGIDLEGKEFISAKQINDFISLGEKALRVSNSPVLEKTVYMMKVVRGMHSTATVEGYANGIIDIAIQAYYDGQAVGRGEMSLADYHDKYQGGEGKVLMDIYNSLEENYYLIKDHQDPDAIGRAIGTVLTSWLFKGGKGNIAKGKVANQAKNSVTANITKLRNSAVRSAWKQEKAMIENTGVGTRNWTRAEIAELKSTGKVKGYAGHHINDVKTHPNLAGNPNNIEFLKTGNTKGGGAVKGSEHYNKHHTSSGKKIESTTGPLLDRGN